MYCNRCGTWAPDAGGACPSCGAPLRAPAPPVAPPPAEPAPDAQAMSFSTPDPPAHLGPGAAGPHPAYGGFWRRFAAWFVDRVVLLFPLQIITVLMGLPTTFSLRPIPESETGRYFAGMVLMLALQWLYAAVLESSRWQGTLGTQLLDLCVTDVAGRRVSFGRASGRYFGWFMSFFLCGGLGYFFNLWTSRRQTLHDQVSGCVVTRREPEPPVLHRVAPGTGDHLS
jgi:uncharacterized RDD family membrane protein YckC